VWHDWLDETLNPEFKVEAEASRSPGFYAPGLRNFEAQPTVKKLAESRTAFGTMRMRQHLSSVPQRWQSSQADSEIITR